MSSVPRVGRVLDLVGLGFFVAGLGLYARAWVGFQEVRAYTAGASAASTSAVEIADGFWRMERFGIGLMVLGVAVFVAAWRVARSKRAA